MLDGKTAYEQNKGLVMGYLYRLCHDEDLANELTQETFYQALKQWDQFRGKSNLGTWLCTIARNLYYRSLRKNDAVSLSVIPEPEIPDFTEKVANHSLAVTVHKALHELQEPYREVFTLRTFCDLSYKEIGDLFEKSESWARVIYYRAKRRLQETMKGENVHEQTEHHGQYTGPV